MFEVVGTRTQTGFESTLSSRFKFNSKDLVMIQLRVIPRPKKIHAVAYVRNRKYIKWSDVIYMLVALFFPIL